MLNNTGMSGSHRAGGNLVNVVAVQNHLGNEDHVLLDSEATDSVTNNVILFKSLKETYMSLIVALTDRFPVRKIGDIELNTREGILRVSNVVFCPEIKGTIISVGIFKQGDGKV